MNMSVDEKLRFIVEGRSIRVYAPGEVSEEQLRHEMGFWLAARFQQRILPQPGGIVLVNRERNGNGQNKSTENWAFLMPAADGVL
jgi:hypothetical protein